jgi:hypothetical protein
MKKTKGVKGSARLLLTKEAVRMLGASDIKQVAGATGECPTCHGGTCTISETGHHSCGSTI